MVDKAPNPNQVDDPSVAAKEAATAIHALAVPHTLMSDKPTTNLLKSGGLLLIGSIAFSFARTFNVSLAGTGPVDTSFVWFITFCILVAAAVVAFFHRDFSAVELDLFRLSALLMVGLIVTAFLVGLLSLATVPANWFANYEAPWLGELMAFAAASILTFGLIAWWTRSRSPVAWHRAEKKARWFAFYCIVNVIMLFIVTNAAIRPLP